MQIGFHPVAVVLQYNTMLNGNQTKQTKTNSVVLVRKRTMATERPPLVGEVSSKDILKPGEEDWKAIWYT
jgi:hypothetical protein